MDEKEKNRGKNIHGLKIQHWKIIAVWLMAYDAAAIAFSYFFGLWLRFDFHYTSIQAEFLDSYEKFIPFYIIASILFFSFARMYRGIWRFAGFHELLRYSLSSIIASAVHTVVITLVCGRMPFSYYIGGAMMQLILVVGIRFSYRFYMQVIVGKDHTAGESTGRKVMIIGAGAAGRTVVSELQQSDKINTVPCCFIDDNANKWNRYMEGIPVVGGREDIPKFVADCPKTQYSHKRNILQKSLKHLKIV